MISTFFSSVRGWIARVVGRRPAGTPQSSLRKAVFFEGDELPAALPPFDLIVARETGVLWSAGMICPCGCGRRIEVMLLDGVKPRWDLTVDEQNLPTLMPSVWVANGCRSHFWLREGLIEWCKGRKL
ncbi:DUF6527 family protein [Mesorhizobium sp. M0895]|uniref:DUF6527 family protein n=1 Tax=Mesorhizobium sp. M0895 TaxID=2957019 RepID=UPI00333C2CFC